MIIHELIERLLNSAQNMVNVMYLDAPGRLAYTIVNLSVSSPQQKKHIRITQNTLAVSAGMARQTAAKILGLWKNEGILSIERGGFKILDMDRLLNIILESEMKN